MKVGMVRVLLGILLVGLMASEGLARRTHFTPEQKDQLQAIHTVWVKVLALTERGKGDGQAIQEIIQERLTAVGYQVVTSREEPSDVMLMVKCEEQKKWAGTTRQGGDADHTDAPARLWKGPACLFTYLLGGRDLGWQKEARTDFADAVSAAKAANAPKSGPYALTQLAQRLQTFDFPAMLAAEWGHDTRLFTLLKDPKTTTARKLKILSLLPEMQSHETLPQLKEFIQDKELAKPAIIALASSGSEAIPLLTEVFKTHQDSTVRAAAAKGLGEIGSHTGDPTITPPILDYLVQSLQHMKTSADIDFPVLSEVVWSLGKLRNENSIPPLRELEKKVWLIYDTSKEMEELREATNWTIKMVDMDGQIQ
ncbi:MAG: HEAT repeat domain-containing protein [Nitrospirota bacterium]|nr:HEAT repeat domain-containing protein [Nitrospirota bacterium]MDH5585603.1 HEAT repeat domain-containing protein [Nitrospirota bacterium]MDH5774780.1 HEAT repeat domain-containing protein [Nitrospirota bacterium]